VERNEKFLAHWDLVVAGKGSKPRPLSVSADKFSDNWDKIFDRRKKSLSGSLSGKDPV